MQNKDIIEVLSPLSNPGRSTLHVNLAEALQLSRPLICKTWQLSFESYSLEIKLRTPKLQNVTTLHKYRCSELVICLCYKVILQFQLWLMNAFTSKKTHASIQTHLEIPNKRQYLTGILILTPMNSSRFILVHRWLEPTAKSDVLHVAWSSRASYKLMFKSLY